MNYKLPGNKGYDFRSLFYEFRDAGACILVGCP